jgi:hypothetical protein
MDSSYPSPANAWGGWPSRSDGRVGAPSVIEKAATIAEFEDPHPGSLGSAKALLNSPTHPPTGGDKKESSGAR